MFLRLGRNLTDNWDVLLFVIKLIPKTKHKIWWIISVGPYVEKRNIYYNVDKIAVKIGCNPYARMSFVRIQFELMCGYHLFENLNLRYLSQIPMKYNNYSFWYSLCTLIITNEHICMRDMPIMCTYSYFSNNFEYLFRHVHIYEKLETSAIHLTNYFLDSVKK